MPRHNDVPIPPDKERYYDEAAREKRALRAKKASEVNIILPSRAYPRLRNVRHDPLTEEAALALLQESDTALDEYLANPLLDPIVHVRPYEWMSDSEHYINELWKDQIIKRIDQRISWFQDEHESSRSAIKEKSNHQPQCLSSTSQRLFQIPELVEIILRFANPEAQLVAWHVSTMWRDTVKHIIQTMDAKEKFMEIHPCGAVTYGDSVASTVLYWTKLDEGELEQYLVRLRDAQEKLRLLPKLDGEMTATFLPACLTQATNLPDAVAANTQIFNSNQAEMFLHRRIPACRELRRQGLTYEHLLPTYGTPGSPNQPGPHTPRWLDLSQFRLNPYLLAFLGSNCTLTYGRLDIKIPPNYQKTFEMTPSMDDIIGPMFATQPPIKCVCLYGWCHLDMDAFVWSNLEDYAIIEDDNGITIEQLLYAVQEFASKAIENWISEAQTLRGWVENGHWKYDVWSVESGPSIKILLSNSEIQYADDDQWLQVVNREPRHRRQAEWMLYDQMKPPRPKSTESDVLPGIYSIGLHEPVFQDICPPPGSRRLEYKKVFEKILAEYVEEGNAQESA